MSTTMQLQAGATFVPRVLTEPGTDVTGHVYTLSIARRSAPADVAALLRVEMAGVGIVGGDGVAASAEVSAADMRDALPPGQYMAGLGYWIPRDGQDAIEGSFPAWDVTVARSIPEIPADSATHGAANAVGVVYNLTLPGPAGPQVVEISLPQIVYLSGGASPAWGAIGGTLADQTDLAAALAAKADTTDPRLSDARAPTAHAASHATDGSDPIAGLHSHANAATLAKITEAAGLPLWNGGAWPGGSGGGGPTGVDARGTIGTSALTLAVGTYAATTATVSDGATIVLALSGAVAGTRYLHELYLTCLGAVTIQYPPTWQWADGSDLSLSGAAALITVWTDGTAVVAESRAISATPSARASWPLTAASWAGGVFADTSPAGLLPLSVTGQGAPASPTWDGDGLWIVDGVDDQAAPGGFLPGLNGRDWAVELIWTPANVSQANKIILGIALNPPPSYTRGWSLSQNGSDLIWRWALGGIATSDLVTITASSVLSPGVAHAILVREVDGSHEILIGGVRVGIASASRSDQALTSVPFRIGRSDGNGAAGAIGHIVITGGY